MAEKYIDWSPVSLSYINNKLDMAAVMHGSTDGIVFSYNPLQDNIKAISANQNTIALLTENSKLSALQNESVPQYSDTNIIRNNIRTNNRGYYLTKTNTDSVNFSTSENSINNTFKLEFDENDLVVSIVSEDINDKKYLTIASNGLSSYFDVFNTSYDYRQQFKYLLDLNANTLVLLCDVDNTSSYKVLSYDEASTSTSVSAVSSFDSNLSHYFTFRLSNTDRTIKSNLVEQSKYVQYETILENNKTLYADLEILSSIPFDNNYLFTLEPKGSKEALEDYHISIKSNNMALKNLLNSKYHTSKDDATVSNRDYNGVILGNNLDQDYFNKALLTYQSTKTQINLLADKITWFHYPYGSESISISASNLINAGAIAGPSPEKSDRIWKMQHGYESRGNKGKSLGIQNGKWLCSWLKSTTDGYQWMDRWYDPTNVTYKLALTADEPNLYISDVQSSMTMDPGCLYKYFHIGKGYSLDLIEGAAFNEYAKILEIKDWDSPSVSITNGTSANIEYTKFNESELILNGTEYVEFSANSSFMPTHQLSMALWVNFDNWRNISADQIIGNYYDGGYSLNFETGIKTDIVIFADRTYGHLFVANTENKYIADKALPGLSATVTDISYNDKGEVWVLDGVNKKVHVYDPVDNLFTSTIALPDGTDYVFSNHDTEGNYYVYDQSNKLFTKIANITKAMTHTQLINLTNTFLPISQLKSFPISGFFIDTSGNIQPYIGTTAFEDDNGDIWHHFGSNFVKNNEEYVLHLCSPDDLVADGDYNFWFIKDKTLYHIDNEGNILLNKTYPYLTEGIKKLTLTRELTNKGWADFVWILDGNSLIKYDTDGRYVKISKPKEFLNITQYDKRNRNNLDIFLPKNSTKYGFCRDRKIIPPGLADENYITANFDVEYGNTILPIKLKHDTSTMTKGWHHLAFVFDSSNGSAILYVDGVASHQVLFNIGAYSLSYTNKNKFYIGNINGFNDTKSQDYLLNNDTKMIGRVDDVRIYNKVLTNNDLIVLSRKKLEFADMPFNVTTTPRQYVEEIDKINSHRIPGFKSNVFNIRILNSSISDEALKDNIEGSICSVIKKITPVGSKLNKIVWE